MRNKNDDLSISNLFFKTAYKIRLYLIQFFRFFRLPSISNTFILNKKRKRKKMKAAKRIKRTEPHKTANLFILV